MAHMQTKQVQYIGAYTSAPGGDASQEYAPRAQPVNSPWGAVQQSVEWAPGIGQVSTASHGGLYIHADRAAELLTPHAQERATYSNSLLLWYEEDCDWCVLAWELPALWPVIFQYMTYAKPRAYLLKSLSTWHLAYLEAKGVQPDADAAAWGEKHRREMAEWIAERGA